MSDFDMLGPAGSPTAIQLGQVEQQAGILQKVMHAKNLEAEAATKNAELADQQAMKAALQEMAGIKKAQAVPPPGLPGQAPGPEGGPQTPPSPTSMADQLDGFAQGFLDRGLLKPAQEIAGQSALIRARQTAAEARQAETALKQLEMPHKAAMATAQILQGAVDQATWDQANAQLAGMGLFNKYAKAPFTPQLRDALVAQSLTAKEKLDLQMKQIDDERAARHESSWEKFSNQRLQIMKDAAKELKDYRKETLKVSGAGGATAGNPSKDDILAAVQLLKRDPDYKELPKDELNFAARTIAADAQARWKSNKGLDAATALEQAMQANKEAIKTTSTSYGLFDMTSKTFKGKGASPTTALPMQGADKAKYKKGLYYETAAGPAIFNGDGFDVIDGEEGGAE